jgi:hypothetical protein
MTGYAEREATEVMTKARSVIEVVLNERGAPRRADVRGARVYDALRNAIEGQPGTRRERIYDLLAESADDLKVAITASRSQDDLGRKE